MSACSVQSSADIELYFYGELTAAERDSVERHLTTCAECCRALEELTIIRAVLASRPDVATPPGGDWSGFMARLQDALNAEATLSNVRSQPRVLGFRPRVAAALAMAALVVLVTASVLIVVRQRGASRAVGSPEGVAGTGTVTAPQASGSAVPAADDPALVSLSEQHFERSKLVVLGLATKDPSATAGSGWDYERRLATSLLNDTRLYRLAAEERGMKTLAGVMRDLELLLLQTSMSEESDAESLTQLQRLIRRRDLVTKMDVVSTRGL